jgi:hypothetical protein
MYTASLYSSPESAALGSLLALLATVAALVRCPLQGPCRRLLQGPPRVVRLYIV